MASGNIEMNTCLLNHAGTEVTLTQQVPYTCPSDGYLTTGTVANTNVYTHVVISDDSNTNFGQVVTPSNASWNNIQMTYVRKGMILNAVAADGINSFATFRPIV